MYPNVFAGMHGTGGTIRRDGTGTCYYLATESGVMYDGEFRPDLQRVRSAVSAGKKVSGVSWRRSQHEYSAEPAKSFTIY